jgi:hypothetical protein
VPAGAWLADEPWTTLPVVRGRCGAASDLITLHRLSSARDPYY